MHIWKNEALERKWATLFFFFCPPGYSKLSCSISLILENRECLFLNVFLKLDYYLIRNKHCIINDGNYDLIILLMNPAVQKAIQVLVYE